MTKKNPFAELEALRKLMGAPPSDWTFDSVEREELLGELIRGKMDVSIDEIDVAPGKPLTYRGAQIILHIKDTGDSLWTLKRTPEKSKRFHVLECFHVEHMRSTGRGERYIVSRRSDGFFLVDGINRAGRKEETEAALKVCKTCLRMLNYRGYAISRRRIRDDIWRNFSILDFLLDHSTFFRSLPRRDDTSALVNEYPRHWAKISQRQKRRADWKCEECRVDLSEHRGASLHCHHRSGVVTDNSDRNLAVLCALCHAKQPYHQRIRISQAVRDKIEQARAAQGIG